MNRIMNFFENLSKPVRYGLYAVLLIVLLVLPRFISSGYLMGILCQMMYYTVLAGSLNVINGYTNQFSLGHAGFFAVGCYTCIILQTRLGVPFWIAMLAGGLLTAVVGFLVSVPTYRLSGIYLSIVTLGFSEIIRLIALNWTSVTGGPMGIKSIPAPNFFGINIRKPADYFYIFLGLAVLFLFVTSRILKSRVGRAWMSIREDQQAAQSLGVELTRYKALNFMYASFWAGIIGAAYGPYYQFIDSTIFTLDEGFNILSMVIIGGLGTLPGPIVGSVIVVSLSEFLRPISQFRLVAYGVLIIAMMWLRPQGLIGASNSVLAAKGERKKKPIAEGEPVTVPASDLPAAEMDPAEPSEGGGV